MRSFRVIKTILFLTVILVSSHISAEEDVDKKFWIRQGLSQEEVLKLVGPPDARYKNGKDEYWLYANAVKEKNGVKTAPTLLFKDGKFMQTNWTLHETVKKSVEIVKGFENWTPPAEEKEKTFLLSDTNVVGKTCAEVLTKLGQPDAKTVFDGKEIWVYRLVRINKTDPKTISIQITIEAGKATGSTGG